MVSMASMSWVIRSSSWISRTSLKINSKHHSHRSSFNLSIFLSKLADQTPQIMEVIKAREKDALL